MGQKIPDEEATVFSLQEGLKKVPQKERAERLKELDALGEKRSTIDGWLREALMRLQIPILVEEEDTVLEFTLEQELSLKCLKGHFEENESALKTGLDWAEVETKLRKNPKKLGILRRLIIRGGEPTVTAILPNGNFRFDELSRLSPLGHRDIDLDAAEKTAEALGVELMEPSVCASFKGKVSLDFLTFSWLKTTKEERSTGLGMGSCGGEIRKGPVIGHHPNTGFRCSVEV